MSAEMSLKEEDLKEWLKPVEDPELFMSLVELGLIYEAKETAPKKVDVKMTLTSPGCPAGDYLVNAVKTRMEEHESVEACEVELVWEPQWDPAEMASEEAKDKLGIW